MSLRRSTSSKLFGESTQNLRQEPFDGLAYLRRLDSWLREIWTYEQGRAATREMNQIGMDEWTRTRAAQWGFAFRPLGGAVDDDETT